MAAVYRKLASDYNDNEILNAFGYAANSHGMRKFCGEQLQGKGKFGRQEMLALANDISFINESRNHYDTSRMTTMENGQWRWYTEKEHIEVALSEINKRNDRELAQKLNRLSYGGEDASGKFHLNGLGAGILRHHIVAFSEQKFATEHMNTNIAKKILEAENDVRRALADVSPKLVEKFFNSLRGKINETMLGESPTSTAINMEMLFRSKGR